MKQHPVTLGVGILGLAVAAGITSAVAATPTDTITDTSTADQSTVEAYHDAITQDLQNGDYDAWAADMKAAADAHYQHQLDNISEDTYNQMKTRLDNGEPIGDGMGMRHDRMHGPNDEGRGEQFEAIKAAVQANDFAAWKDIVSNGPGGADFATEANFELSTQVDQLMQSGDQQGARKIMQQLHDARQQ